MAETEIRCPAGPQRLFAKLHDVDSFAPIRPYIEFACSDCKRSLRDAGKSVARVLHRYNLLGEYLQTEVVPLHTFTAGPDGR